MKERKICKSLESIFFKVSKFLPPKIAKHYEESIKVTIVQMQNSLEKSN